MSIARPQPMIFHIWFWNIWRNILEKQNLSISFMPMLCFCLQEYLEDNEQTDLATFTEKIWPNVKEIFKPKAAEGGEEGQHGDNAQPPEELPTPEENGEQEAVSFGPGSFFLLCPHLYLFFYSLLTLSRVSEDFFFSVHVQCCLFTAFLKIISWSFCCYLCIL